MCFSAAASSEKFHGSMNLASNTAPVPSIFPSSVAAIHLWTLWNSRRCTSAITRPVFFSYQCRFKGSVTVPSWTRRSADRFSGSTSAAFSIPRERRPAMKIYGDTNSGNCLKVKWVCDYLALPYTWIAIDVLKQETRTAQFLKLNSAGQVPVVEFDDGRALAQSNAIIRYLARGSDLIATDAFAAAKMDEWLFWEQYSHEPAIAVCRYRMVYLGHPASDLDPHLVKRGYAALARMEQQLAQARFLVGEKVT